MGRRGLPSLATGLLAGSMTLVGVVLPGTVGPEAAAAEYTCDGLSATIVGTDGKDTLIGTPGPDVIVGLGEVDVIKGKGGADVICGGPGADELYGGGGADRLFGQQDKVRTARYPFTSGDVLRGGDGSDLLDPGYDPAGEGLRIQQPETISYVDSPVRVVVDLGAGTARGLGADTLVVVPHLRLIGSQRPDVITGSAGDDDIWARGGDDRVDALAGDDRVEADNLAPSRHDDDVVDAGPGDDYVLSRRGLDRVDGGEGDDGLFSRGEQPVQLRGGDGGDTLHLVVSIEAGTLTDGGPGTDHVMFSSVFDDRRPTHRVDVDRAAGEVRVRGYAAATSTLVGVEAFLLADRIIWRFFGTDEADRVDVSRGQLRAFTRGGDDVVEGDNRDDYVDAGPGHDRVKGHPGYDTCLNAEERASCEVTG